MLEGPHNEEYRILGFIFSFILGSPYLGNMPDGFALHRSPLLFHVANGSVVFVVIMTRFCSAIHLILAAGWTWLTPYIILI